MSKPKPVRPNLGQESVWDYPRPPRLEQVTKPIQVIFRSIVIADTRGAWRVLETSHPPVYYIPASDVMMKYLSPSSETSSCEWKGRAGYYDVVVKDQVAKKAAWSYPSPTPAFRTIQDHLAFYAWGMDQCLVDGEQVRPQPGNFYGGWITDDIVGPFKGEPGTWGW